MASEGPNFAYIRRRIKEHLEEEPRFAVLREKILKIGGTEVVPRPEPDMEELIESGKVLDFPVVLNEMGMGRCHTNSWELATSNLERYVLCTGWALSLSSGLWIQHSWVFDEVLRCLVETTSVRGKYFGLILY